MIINKSKAINITLLNIYKRKILILKFTKKGIKIKYFFLYANKWETFKIFLQFEISKKNAFTLINYIYYFIHILTIKYAQIKKDK